MEKKFQPVLDTPVQSLSKESEEKLALLNADLVAIRKMGSMEKFFGSENCRNSLDHPVRSDCIGSAVDHAAPYGSWN